MSVTVSTSEKAAAIDAPAASQTYDDIIVAVHGIGAQSRNATVRSVANRLAQSSALRRGSVYEPLAPQPLGYFHTDVRGAVKVFPLDRFKTSSFALARTGFAEVFWADIPQDVAKEGRTIEETKAWGRTVVARAHAIFRKHKEQLSDTERLRLKEPDFTLAAEVIDEIIDTIAVLQHLFFIAEKAGTVKFDLRDVLDEYVGDVQVVTEFTLFRREIIGRFHRALEQIHQTHPEARLHIVAHSEGTVVSFLGLLHALCGERLKPAVGEGSDSAELSKDPLSWRRQLHGYMTIGSPIDKHILLWPELFDPFDLTDAHQSLGLRRIQWRNYYDYGDPVGFKLDTARRWLRGKQCQAFDFEEHHDIGFARYLLPGKAHNDYWADPAIFEHFVNDVIAARPDLPVRKPHTRPAIYFLSPLLPYFVSFLVLCAGTLIFYRAVRDYTNPSLDSVQSYVRLMTVGNFPDPGATSGQLTLNALAVTALVAGVTLFARLPRLAKGWKWWATGAAAFLLGCVAYRFGVAEGSRQMIGKVFSSLGLEPTYSTLAGALVVALIGMTAITKPKADEASASAIPGETHTQFLRRIESSADYLLNRRASRRTRWLCKRMRPLIACGMALILLLVGFQISDPPPPLSSKEWRDMTNRFFAHYLNEATGTLGIEPAAAPTPPNVQAQAEAHAQAENRAESIKQLVQFQPPVWPVILAGAAFLYLWWLAALIFDLAFVWHRYVRRAVGIERLAQWRPRLADPSTNQD